MPDVDIMTKYDMVVKKLKGQKRIVDRLKQN